MGNDVAVLAVDVRASKLDELTHSTFTPLVYFLLFFTTFFVIRLMAFNRPLLGELFHFLAKFFCSRSVQIIIIVSGLLALSITYAMYSYTLHFNAGS